MTKKIIKIGIICFIAILAFSCASAASAPATDNSAIVGTWAYVEGNVLTIIQYRSTGYGCEVVINQPNEQSEAFELSYRPFTYALSNRAVFIEFFDLEEERIFTFQMPAADRLVLADYTDEGGNLTLIRQSVSNLDGLWQRSDSETDKYEYLFISRSVIMILNGVPQTFSNYLVSGDVLTINHLRDKDRMNQWVETARPQIIYQFWLDDEYLLLSSATAGEHLFARH